MKKETLEEELRDIQRRKILYMEKNALDEEYIDEMIEISSNDDTKRSRWVIKKRALQEKADGYSDWVEDKIDAVYLKAKKHGISMVDIEKKSPTGREVSKLS
jgi:response regulator of citrate/malate metabolism